MVLRERERKRKRQEKEKGERVRKKDIEGNNAISCRVLRSHGASHIESSIYFPLLWAVIL